MIPLQNLFKDLKDPGEAAAKHKGDEGKMGKKDSDRAEGQYKMKRNQGGERDLDHIIHASIRGMEQACLEYATEAGLILCLAR